MSSRPVWLPARLQVWLLPSMQGYQPAWWRLDVLAGLAAGTVVIPQAMAYATIAGLPVEIGLYTCMVPMVVYALLGGSRAPSVSTTPTIAVLVATSLAGLSPRSADDLPRDAFTLTALVGVCLLAMRAFRLGSLVRTSARPPSRESGSGWASRWRSDSCRTCSE